MIEFGRFLPSAAVLLMAGGLVGACASTQDAPFLLGDASAESGATAGPGGAGSIPPGSGNAPGGGNTPGAGNAPGAGSVPSATGGFSATGAGGAGSGCPSTPSFCPARTSGAVCCLANGSCGVNFGMGCVAAPSDAGTGAGGRIGSGGFTSGTGGSTTGAGGAMGSGGSTSAGDGGPPPPVTDASATNDKG